MKAFIFLMIAVIAQVTVFQHLKEYGIAFNIVLGLIVVMGFMGGQYQRLIVPAFFTGILLDSMSGAPFGTMTIALVTTTIVLSMLAPILAQEHMLHFAVFAITGAFIFTAIVFLIIMVLRPYTSDISLIGALYVVGYNSAGAFITYVAYRWITLLKNRIVGQ